MEKHAKSVIQDNHEVCFKETLTDDQLDHDYMIVSQHINRKHSHHLTSRYRNETIDKLCNIFNSIV
jgi:hypothetical protein